MALKPINDAYWALAAKRKMTGVGRQNVVSEIHDNIAEKAIETEEANANKKFIQENPTSYISLIALESYAYSADYIDVPKLFIGLSTAVLQTETGRKMAERLSRLKAVALGILATEFAEAVLAATS